MKKIKYFIGILALLLIMFLPIELSYSLAETNENNYTTETKICNISQLSQNLFGDVKIIKSEELFNFDDSPDYIYVEYENNGYAIFLKETMELMEYSPQGSIKFFDEDINHYYGGPGSYLKKQEDQFFDICSKETFSITEKDKKSYSNNIRNNLMKNYNNLKNKSSVKFDYNASDILNNTSSNKTPGYDARHLCYAYDGTFIPNYQYFMKMPKHGNNTNGTCGAVAAQLLLSYHNYYSDRRIIADKYLNGDWDKYSYQNPNYCYDPMSMTPDTLGTRGYDENGSDDNNSYFAYIVNKIPASSNIIQIKNGIKDIIEDSNKEIDFSLTLNLGWWFFGKFAVNPDGIKSEIDEGRPVLISIVSNEKASRHAIIAHGYCDYTYANSNEQYFGFITHFGWINSGGPNVWINSSWCYDYISLKINHTHTYKFEKEIDSYRNEYKCTECGHRTDAAIFMDNVDRYEERIATIPQNSYTYKDYYVTFNTAGNKLFQTYGTKDAVMYLYDNEYNKLANDDDSGYESNALISYTVEKSKPYILRVELKNKDERGLIKIGITPASETYSDFGDICKLNGLCLCISSEVPLYSTCVMTITPIPNEIYQFYTLVNEDTNGINDSYIYLIDPLSTDYCIYDDDSAGNRQAKIETQLKIDREYILILSAYNISSESGILGLCVMYN